MKKVSWVIKQSGRSVFLPQVSPQMHLYSVVKNSCFHRSITIALPFPLICFLCFSFGRVGVDEEVACGPFYVILDVTEGTYGGMMVSIW
jgi:hypothetical protein